MSVNSRQRKTSASFCKIALLVVLVLSLGACTAKVSYRFLDWIIAWSVDDYIDWNNQQQQQFDRVVADLLTWHQRTQLKRYSEFLAQLQRDLSEPLSRELLTARMDEAEQLWTVTIREVAPQAVTLLMTLSDEQVNELGENLAKSTDKISKRYSSTDPQKLDRKRIKSVEKMMARFIGKLNSEQKEIVEQWSLRLEDSREPWIQSRKQWAVEFVRALQGRQGTAFPGRVYTLMVQPQSLWSEDYTVLVDNNVSHGIDLVLSLQASLTDKQQQRLNDYIDEWIEAFDQLSVQAEEARLGGIQLL